MSNIENELNKRFEHQQLSDDNFDGEGLWEAIAEDLDDGKPSSAPSFSKAWIGLLLLLFVLGAGWALLYWPSKDAGVLQKSIPQAIDDRTDVGTKEGHSFSLGAGAKSSPSSLAPKSETTNTTTINNTTAKSTEAVNINANSIFRNTPKKQTQERHVEHLGTPSEQSLTSISTPIPDKVNSSTPSAIRNLNPKKEDIPKRENSTTSTLANSQAQMLIRLSSKFAFLESNLPTLSPLELVKSKSRIARNQSAIRWSAGVSGGVNTLHFNYQSDDFSEIAALKEGAEKKFFGVSYGVHAGLLLNNRWSLNSGVERHQLWSKFEYEEQKAIQVEKKDHLLKFWVDATSGDTLNRLYGDTSADAISTRNVVHYNEYQRLSLPLEVGLQNQLGKFLYGIRAGLVFNFTTQQSGKTLNQLGEISSFEGNHATSTFKSFDIGLRLSPLLAYQLSEQWTLNLQPQWMWQRRTAFADTDIKIGIHQFNLNLSASYFFN